MQFRIKRTKTGFIRDPHGLEKDTGVKTHYVTAIADAGSIDGLDPDPKKALLVDRATVERVKAFHAALPDPAIAGEFTAEAVEEPPEPVKPEPVKHPEPKAHVLTHEPKPFTTGKRS